MNINDAAHWIQERMPATLIGGLPELAVYDDEVVVMLPLVFDAARWAEQPAAQRQAAHQLIAQHREETRPLRMKLARELQKQLGLPVAWGMRAGPSEQLFTTRSAPVMTRLGRAEREVLDTLVAAGVADTRSAALAYAVRAFAHEHAGWLAEVRAAIAHVEQVRARLTLSPRPGPPSAPQQEAAES